MAEICLITGNHPRHKYFADRLISTGEVCSWIIERREELIPTAPSNLSMDLKNLFYHHFQERKNVENNFFPESLNYDSSSNVPILQVDNHTLNNRQTADFIKKYTPSLIISYGCHKLSDSFMNAIGVRFWNVHGGLSPYYRGVATHFWPSYFLEPQMTGMTLHETTDFLDAGEIILQTAAPLVAGDTLHQLAARNVKYFTESLSINISKLDFTSIPKGMPQSVYGKVFMSKDWRPEHLRLIYQTYRDSIVDCVINGEITGREPKLISVL